MSNTVEASEFQAKLSRLETLIQQSERLPDPARTHARELVQSLLDVHGTALTQLLKHVAANDTHSAILDACAADEVVSGLLLLHGLHPLELEDRVRQALEHVRPAIRAHGDVVLLAVEAGTVQLRFEGGCGSCASSTTTMRQVIEDAIFAHAPEIAAVEIEGLADATTEDAGRFALPVL